MNGRIERLRAELDRLEVASFLVSNPVNVRYLTGFESSNAFVLVRPDEVVLMEHCHSLECTLIVPEFVSPRSRPKVVPQ